MLNLQRSVCSLDAAKRVKIWTSDCGRKLEQKAARNAPHSSFLHGRLGSSLCQLTCLPFPPSLSPSPPPSPSPLSTLPLPLHYPSPFPLPLPTCTPLPVSLSLPLPQVSRRGVMSIAKSEPEQRYLLALLSCAAKKEQQKVNIEYRVK